MLKKVEYPSAIRRGIRHLEGSNASAKNLRVFGGDTETVRGHAHTVQIASEGESVLLYVEDATAFAEFWGWIKHRLRPKGTNVCYFHNLNFDLRVLFARKHNEIFLQQSEIKLDMSAPHTTGGPEIKERNGPYTQESPVQITMLFGKVNVATIVQGDLKLRLFDSMAFTQAGLARSLKMFQIPYEKMQKPEGLGREYLRGPDFEEYALRDAVAVRALGLRIMEFHEKYQVKPSMTLPSYTARVFRRHFLLKGETIPFPPEEVARASEFSYHGGKNGFYLAEPIVVEDAYEVDISSAYPFAMKNLPPITEGFFMEVKDFLPGYAGVYLLKGDTGSYDYPLVFDHSFKPLPRRRPYDGIWTFSYEAERILKRDSSRVVRGYAWVPAEEARNPLARFVDHFYGLKEGSAKDDPYYNLYKIVLNSYYGKFVAATPRLSDEQKAVLEALRKLNLPIGPELTVNGIIDPKTGERVDLKPTWTAGSNYNPFWASAVTSYTRAYLYDLEVKLSAFHAATDSVKALIPHEPIPGLGGLKVECFGRCYCYRNKLYLHFSKGFDFCHHKPDDLPYKYPEGHPRAGEPLVDFDGQHLCKVGMHGFKGQIWELFEARDKLLRDRRLKYEYTHCVGLREGIRRREKPCDFVVRRETLKLAA